ncbi:MAG: hypothetical protein KIH69_003290 [Anaerolineae bacterium]|nr:hypothetical protein [Anaerolineae bacterium]
MHKLIAQTHPSWRFCLGVSILISAIFSAILLSPMLIGFATPLQPLGRHCVDVGPPGGENQANWCGCSWGVVYVDGKPKLGAEVTLYHNGQARAKETDLHSAESFPFYSLRGDVLGAVYGDVVTFTASYLGQTVTRTMRLIPNDDGEQQISFVMPAANAPASLPIVTSVSISPSLVTTSSLIAFNAVTTMTMPVSNTKIVAFEWRSDRDGVLGSEASFVLRSHILSAGVHQIQVRAQDAFGRWSQPLETQLTIQHGNLTPTPPVENYPVRQFLPYVMK